MDGKPLTEDEFKDMMCNPVYVGMGPYPALVSTEAWIGAGVKMIESLGPEEYLRRMIQMLRLSLGACILGPNAIIDGETEGE